MHPSDTGEREAAHRTLGWLGVGRMGAAMARRLLDAGNEVIVWNRTRSKTDPLAEVGARVAGSIAELAAAEVVFVTVSAPKDLEQVVSELLGGGRRPGVIVDCSTIDPQSSAKIRQEVEARGVAFLAAPVSGNPHVVAAGQSTFVVSGPRETYDRVRGYLESIGRASVYVGEGERARLVKLAHNLYLGMLVQSLAEVTTLAEKGGVPRETFLGFLNDTVLATSWVRNRTPDMLSLDWTPTFTTELLRKDFDLGLAAARAEEVPMPLAASVLQLIQNAIGRGYREADFLSLFEVQAASAGMRLEPR